MLGHPYQTRLPWDGKYLHVYNFCLSCFTSISLLRWLRLFRTQASFDYTRIPSIAVLHQDWFGDEKGFIRRHSNHGSGSGVTVGQPFRSQDSKGTGWVKQLRFSYINSSAHLSPAVFYVSAHTCSTWSRNGAGCFRQETFLEIYGPHRWLGHGFAFSYTNLSVTIMMISQGHGSRLGVGLDIFVEKGSATQRNSCSSKLLAHPARLPLQTAFFVTELQYSSPTQAIDVGSSSMAVHSSFVQREVDERTYLSIPGVMS